MRMSDWSSDVCSSDLPFQLSPSLQIHTSSSHWRPSLLTRHPRARHEDPGLPRRRSPLDAGSRSPRSFMERSLGRDDGLSERRSPFHRLADQALEVDALLRHAAEDAVVVIVAQVVDAEDDAQAPEHTVPGLPWHTVYVPVYVD